MIILEGPDGSGKTTLLKKLSSDLGLQIMPKAIDSQTNAMTDVRTWVDHSLDSGWNPVLYDRHGLISEGIYGPAWNKKLREPYNEALWLINAHARMAAIAPTIIVCLPPIEEVIKNIRKDPTNSVLFETTDRHLDRSQSKVGQIYWQYFWYCKKNLNVFEYDYTTDSYDTVKSFVEMMIENRAPHA